MTSRETSSSTSWTEVEPILYKLTDHQPRAYLKKCLAEFVGTFIYTFFIMIGQISRTSSWSFLHGSLIFLLSLLLGNISGGHFNPAVTTAVFIKTGIFRKYSVWVYLFSYFIWQGIGAWCGAFLAWSLFLAPSHAAGALVWKNSPNFTTGGLFFTEFTATIIFLTVILLVSQYSQKYKYGHGSQLLSLVFISITVGLLGWSRFRKFFVTVSNFDEL